MTKQVLAGVSNINVIFILMNLNNLIDTSMIKVHIFGTIWYIPQFNQNSNYFVRISKILQTTTFPKTIAEIESMTIDFPKRLSSIIGFLIFLIIFIFYIYIHY